MKQLLLAIFTVLIFTGCSTPEPVFKNNDKTLVDLVRHFQSYGIKIDTLQALEFDFFHAEEAIALSIDTKEIGLYRFDLTYKKAKHKVDMVTKKNIFYIQAIPFPAVINGSFMMISHDTHRRGKEFVKIFKAFTTDGE